MTRRPSRNARNRGGKREWGRRSPIGCGGLLCLVAGLVATPAAATTPLSVDLSSRIGPANHVASGSLYGVTESLPGNVDALIAPLRPRMFTNPAANVQQPVGDAILVAERLATTTATVTVRLSDWLTGFYDLPPIEEWLDKVEETVSRRQAAGLTNVYGYEIWNEPNLTYSNANPLPFNDFWRQTYARLRELDPEVPIIGPCPTHYDEPLLRDFLTYCRDQGCLPDIVGWHELGGGSPNYPLLAYRALEEELGIGPLRITINEYGGAARLDAEGQPGAAAPMIAKFERHRVDSACISFWDVAHPGRLGSLLATDSEPNGGWWFYAWYGQMDGEMVSTVPPSPDSGGALDGFANVDEAARSASVLFGGENDGTIAVTVRGFAAAPFLGETVRAVVERTPFVNRGTVVTATDTLSTAELAIVDDQLTVEVTGANARDGYRLLLRPLEGGAGGAGGTAGAPPADGGTAPSGGASSGGTDPLGGSAPAGGVATGGDDSGGGGAITAGGTTSGGAATGGDRTGGAGGTGGAVETGGLAGTGGLATTGGAPPGSGGTAPGSGGTGGASSGSSSGGAPSTGGYSGSTAPLLGGSGGAAAGGSEPRGAADEAGDDRGCGCRATTTSGGVGWATWLALALVSLRQRAARRAATGAPARRPRRARPA